jgi:hypothetical protein
MRKFFQQKKVKNYFDLLAEERAKTERKRIRDVLAKKEAENRLRLARGWVIRLAPQDRWISVPLL